MNQELEKRLAALSPEKRALLMKRLEKKQPATPKAALPPREPGRTQFPLSFAQQSLWMMEHLGAETAANPAAGNLPSAFILRGKLDLAALRGAFQAVVDRHEPLRTGFPMVEGQPVQQVYEQVALEVPLTDISRLDDGSRTAERDRLAQHEAGQPFDLATPPMVRVGVVRCAAEEHLVLVTLHHLVTDGWSTGLFISEFVAAYTAMVTGESWLPEPLQHQYADFALHQRDQAASGLKPHLEYWRKQLDGVPTLLKIDTDMERPARQTTRGAVIPFEWPRSLVDDLNQLARDQGTTLYMVLLAAYKVLLFRYSGEQDIVVGSPIAGRRERAFESMMGLFANTLVMRTRVTPRQGFTDLLAEVKRVSMEAFVHQAAPFEYLLEEINPERSLAHTPWFQMMFTLQNAPASEIVLPGLAVEPFWRGNRAAKLDLSAALTETEQGLWGEIEYNTDIFLPASIRTVIRHWETLLREIVAQPQAPVARLRFLSTTEQETILKRFVGERVAFSKTPMHHFIAERAAAHPERPALISAEGTMRYGELQAAVDRLAAHLIQRGVGPEDAVAVYLERGHAMVIAMLAVLQAGGQYIPLDPFYPQQRIALVLEDAQPRWALTQPSLSDDLPADVEALDTALLLQQEASTTAAEVVPAQLAYTIYTSGSTGRPKGVAIQHDALSNFVHGTLNALPIEASDCLLAVTSISFDITALDVYVTLAAGARVVIADRRDILDGARQLRWIREQGVTVLQATPAHWRLLLDRLGDDRLDHLKALVGGEALNAPLGRLLAEKTASLHNLYGPTEATVWVSQAPFDGSFPMPLGQAYANVQLYLLDSEMNPIPSGAPGELYIGGPAVARCYAGLPQQTADRFVPDPFSKEPGQRLYRTGDLCSIQGGDKLIFHGRVDFQVKVRGFRIELGEIETRLLEHAAIRECVVGVVGGEEDEAEARLVAWLCADGEANPVDLQQWVTQTLPDYMVPAQFVQLESMPLTPNRKVNRKALPIPQAEILERVVRAPETQLQAVLVALWAAVLNHDQVGIEDDFFRLGGNSLKATRFAYRLLQEQGIDMPVHLLFESLTIEKLAARLTAEFPEAAALDVPETAIPDRNRLEHWLVQCWREVLVDRTLEADANFFEVGGDSLSGLQVAGRIQEQYGLGMSLETLFAKPEPATLSAWLHEQLEAGHGGVADKDAAETPIERPLSQETLMRASQRRLWLLERLENGGPAYHISRLLHIDGDLDADQLQRALVLLQQRHESLRTTFGEEDGLGYQRVNPHVPLAWEQVDLLDLAEDQREVALHDQARAIAVVPFDLENGPLWRVCLFQTAPRTFVLLIVLQHLIADGWSLDLLHTDLWQAYRAAGDETAAVAAVATPQCIDMPEPDYDLAAESAWWRDYLADLPPLLELPTDFPRPAELGQAGGWVRTRLSAETVAKLEAGAVAQNATLYTALLTCYQLLLARYTRRRDIVTASPVANRHTSGAEQAVGCFVNTLPIRADINQHLSFTDLLAHVRDQAFAAFAHQHIPFEQIVEALNPQRNLSHATLVQAMFVLNRGRAVPDRPKAFNSRLEYLPLPFAQFDLQLHVDRDENGAGLTFIYNRDLFRQETVERLAGHFQTLATICAQYPRTPVYQKIMMAPEETLRLASWARVRGKRWSTDDVAAAICAQARQRPEAPALVDEVETLSYAELIARSSRLAHFLTATTPADGTPVALLCERRIGTVVAQLATLLAGRPWLALDPELPPQRIADLLADARPALLLTEDDRTAAWSEAAMPVYALDADDVPWLDQPPNPPPRAVPERAAAYTLYTSGSTGRPKAVSVPRRALHNRLAWMQDRFRLDAAEAVLHKTPYSFDVSIWEWLWPLMQGARVVVAPPQAQRDNQHLITLIQQHQVTTIHFVPPMLQAFLETPAAAECHSLRRIIASGEVLTAATVRLCRERLHSGLFNLYGPTEAAIDVSCWDATCAEVDDPLPIGTAVNNVTLHVLDPWGSPVPVGLPGELFIGGIALADGYVGQAALTAERFVPDPFSPDGGARLYRTGDLVKRREDGELVYLRRRDHQVKWNGQRIELGEIEHALGGFDTVARAVVVLHRAEDGRTNLVAYVTGDTAALSPDALQSDLRKLLPRYMVPTHWVVLERFPLTRNGKIDRKALPAPVQDAAADLREPCSETEIALAELWQPLLGVARFGLDDDFFGLGGHSLTMARLAAQIDTRFGVVLSMRQLFNNARLQAMAELIDNQLWLLESRLTPAGAGDDLEMGEL
ncbi:non-ribosomal peptide synthetase [Acanthopleuribacter pedis]|uniref:Amino acid adenylation domain-containing protein n=1 Tax=Acanthopleuribacter pedis TaxID=442870 RepID=A0A8J7U2K4_9BACT|nr:non-ribosomal peptide synthetase [Acanthopleuribacter pedis]MBO1319413.1 amino acid adenylation domain-containing protein [Acanthopleuribacter pedis]